MGILRNAIDSIQIGIEDFKSGDDRRNASAVRNITAGILLLYKEKLCRLSPDHDRELLILKDIRPVINDAGKLQFVGQGDKTVDRADIQKRFSSLKVKTDWDQFNKIVKLRNNIEHYYTTEHPNSVREHISKSFMIIRDFLINELQEEPSHLIGEECWNVLLDVNEVYDKEHEVCADSLNKIDWKYGTVYRALEELRCPSCSSELVKAENYEGEYPEVNLLCNSCGHTFLFTEVLVQCVHDHLFGEAYIAMTDGGEPPYDDCEECGESTFVLEENACMYCCYEVTYEKCSNCDNEVGKYGTYEGLCDFCSYAMDQMKPD